MHEADEGSISYLIMSTGSAVSGRVRVPTMQDAAAIGRVHVDTWRSTYHGIVADEYLSNLSSERSQHNWETALSHSKTQSVFVAEDDQSNVVGFAACGPAREMKETFDGELYAIYVVRKVQRRGTGKELVLAVANDLKVRGLNSMLVWVLAENPFRKFYVALGGEQFASKKTVVGGKTLEELGFGWKSLDLLIERARLRRGLVNQPVD